MATTVAALYRGTLGTTSSTPLYTVSGGVTGVVTNVVIANKSASATTVTLALDGTYVAYALPVDSYQTIVLDMRQVLAATKVITGGAGAAAAIDCHISGVTIT